MVYEKIKKRAFFHSDIKDGLEAVIKEEQTESVLERVFENKTKTLRAGF